LAVIGFGRPAGIGSLLKTALLICATNSAPLSSGFAAASSSPIFLPIGSTFAAALAAGEETATPKTPVDEGSAPETSGATGITVTGEGGEIVSASTVATESNAHTV
jgi:hypothetical protein